MNISLSFTEASLIYLSIYHHICFNVFCCASMGCMVSHGKLPSISASAQVLSDFLFFQFTSDFLIPCFPMSFSVEATANLEGYPQLLDQALSSILAKSPNLYFSILYTFPHAVQFQSTPKFLYRNILRPSVACHLTILASVFFSLITTSTLTDHVSLPNSVMLRTHAEYNMSFAPKGKSLLAKKGTKSLNLLHPFLIFVTTLSIAPPVAHTVSPR